MVVVGHIVLKLAHLIKIYDPFLDFFYCANNFHSLWINLKLILIEDY